MAIAKSAVKSNYTPVYKITLVREHKIALTQPQIRSSADAARVFREYLGEGAAVESFMLAMVDTKNFVIGILTISTGSLSASVVHPRHVFQPAIIHNCASILVAHNHPSGDPAPSREDRELTTRLYEGGQLLGIPLLDHIILGDGCERYFSFADEGILKSA